MARATRSALPFRPPERFDEYRVLRPLGHGTMGRVFLAQDTLLDRPVAIKFIADLDPDQPQGGVLPGLRDRFFVEARAIAVARPRDGREHHRLVARDAAAVLDPDPKRGVRVIDERVRRSDRRHREGTTEEQHRPSSVASFRAGATPESETA